MFELFYSSPLKCGGTFVEIGALDGINFSNSFFFEVRFRTVERLGGFERHGGGLRSPF